MNFNQPSFLNSQNNLPKKESFKKSGKFESNEWAKTKDLETVELVRKLIEDVSILKNSTTEHACMVATNLGFEIDVKEVPQEKWVFIGRKKMIGPDSKPYFLNLIIDNGEPKIFIADPGEDNKLGTGEAFFLSESDIV